MEGYELDQRRGDGRWYTVSRDYAPGTYDQYLEWMRKNGWPRDYSIRQVSPDDPFLSGSLDPDPPRAAAEAQVEENSEDMPTREEQVKKDGADFGAALAIVLTQPDSSDYDGALFTVARRFAKMAGQTDADGALSYIEGFVGSWRQSAGRPQQHLIEDGKGQ